MFELIPELHTKFSAFHDAYQEALVWLEETGAHPEGKDRKAWESAKNAIQLTAIEEGVFRDGHSQTNVLERWKLVRSNLKAYLIYHLGRNLARNGTN